MSKISKLVRWTGLCLMVAAVIGAASVAIPGDQQEGAPPGELPPSPLEAFATRPTAKIVWSKMIGQLESQESRATITALIVEDMTAQPNVMRGVQIDLVHINGTPSCDWKYRAWRTMCRRANAAAYVEEEQLDTVREGIERGATKLHPSELSVSQYWTNAPGRAPSGLIVCGYQFSYLQPGELAALFARAIAELTAVR
jgi:hypothetical protein